MPFNKQKAKEAVYKRWEKERGLEIVIYIKLLKNNVQATGIFRSNEYVTSGKTNVEALNNLMNVLKHLIK